MNPRLLRRHGVRAFVTAWNPVSRRMPAGWNIRTQRAPGQRLRRVTVLAVRVGHATKLEVVRIASAVPCGRRA